MSKVSVADRREYIDSRLNSDWGWTDYTKGPKGWSYRQMLAQMWRVFGKENLPQNPMTIKRDIDILAAQAAVPDEDELSEARALLDPERFPEWRAKFFKVPETGEPFQTPKFQHAIFWVMHAATFKKELPQWVIDLLDELDPKHPFPEDINELLTGDKRALVSFMLLMAPRHGKTELDLHFISHTFATDPNKRIMFGNGTLKKSEGFIDNAIMSFLEGGDEMADAFVEMYGPFKADNRAWSKAGFVLAGRTGSTKSFSMQPFGIDGNIRSFDMDIGIADDPADLKRSRSETMTEDDYTWLTTEFFLRREWQSVIFLLGSHVAVQTGDLWTKLLNNVEKLNVGRQRFIVKTIPAHFYDKCDVVNDPNHEKCVLWPDLRGYDFLEAQRSALDDDAMFEAVYNQVPQTRKMMHFPTDIMRSPYTQVEMKDGKTPPPERPDVGVNGVLDERRSWRVRPLCCGKECLLAFGFDPAASEKKGASFSALVVLGGCSVCGRRYFVDYWKDRQSPEQNPDTIESFVRTYPYVNMINIEINAYQKSLSRDPRMSALEAKSRFVIKEWNTDERKHDPALGIPAAARHAKSGMLSIPFYTTGDQEEAEPLIKEFIRWPQKPNDLIMAFWLADLALAELIEETRYVEAELMPGEDRWRSQWHDEQVVEFDLSLVEGPEWEYS